MFFNRNFLSAFIVLFSVSSTVLAAQDDVSVKDIKQETKDVITTLQAYTNEQKQEALKTAEQAIQNIDSRIDQLENRMDQQWDQLGEDVRSESRQALRELRKDRIRLAEWYGGMKEGSHDAWSEMKDGFNEAYQSIADAWQDAEAAFDQQADNS
ncbi:hypothetical protein [Oceanospirillum beijerinckii]|uniref:hypothetical protein n=1 Tax=Oceanospirillum beijerinckii TaxID=64976 RepID=UPI0003FDB8F2|nr:hypothetical protein [Oceanospirillum beijerinckii]